MKIAIFTANIDKYDTVKVVKSSFLESDKFQFTPYYFSNSSDEEIEARDNGWKFVYVDPLNMSAVDFSKFIKIVPQNFNFMNDFDAWVWVDGNRYIKGSMHDLVEEYIAIGNDFISMTHVRSKYNCIYRELEECKIHPRGYLQSKDPKQKRRINKLFDRQIGSYQHEGVPSQCYPHVENGTIYRCNTKNNQLLSLLWWAEYWRVQNSRDQVPLRYVAWRFKFKLGRISRSHVLTKYIGCNRHCD